MEENENTQKLAGVFVAGVFIGAGLGLWRKKVLRNRINYVTDMMVNVSDAMTRLVENAQDENVGVDKAFDLFVNDVMFIQQVFDEI